MSDGPEFTRWRELENPVSPLDPIQPGSPRYEAGKLPAGFVLLCWSRKQNRVHGPVRFPTPKLAETFVKDNDINEYLIIPKPNTNAE